MTNVSINNYLFGADKSAFDSTNDSQPIKSMPSLDDNSISALQGKAIRIMNRSIYSADFNSNADLTSYSSASYIEKGSLSGSDILMSSSARKTVLDTPRTISSSQPGYYFDGNIPEDVLHRYLDKAITMQGITDESGDPYALDVYMLVALKPTFVGRAIYFWGGPRGKIDLTSKCNLLRDSVIATIRPTNTDVIFQGAVFEYIDDGTNENLIPKYVKELFYSELDEEMSGFYTYDHFVNNDMYFHLPLMIYHSPDLPFPRDRSGAINMAHYHTPDITKVYTRMWFYYLATNYIDAGCEAIHMGDVFLMNRADYGNQKYWGLLRKIRDYGKANARNGVVLCDSHGADSTAYYDPSAPLPNWQRQLLFDFHSLGTYYSVVTYLACTPTYQPLELLYGAGLLNNSVGGLNPQGWLCSHNPSLMEFDNGGINPDAGCGFSDHFLYGFDNSTWFAKQGISSFASPRVILH